MDTDPALPPQHEESADRYRLDQVCRGRRVRGRDDVPWPISTVYC
jgi:hypothetical protein